MRPSISLVAGIGVEGDAHAGATVQHRSRVAADPTQPNLRQVHLMHSELHEELRAAGYPISPGALGENITTRGIDLLALPVGTTLTFDGAAVVAITGLRNPCRQLDDYADGLMSTVAYYDSHGDYVRKAGVMGVVIAGGLISPGMEIRVGLPALPHRALDRV
ncbi:MAG TPA: MOSC domain-containing protein [Mycobacteriales bacterium]|nr:MOSC domain-containing protein [Mycobacteriales bacterium]